MTKRLKIKEILRSEPGRDVVVKGWVRTRRGNKNVSFVSLSDGSTVKLLQIVFDHVHFSEEQLKDIATGACISVSGECVASPGQGQAVEVHAASFEIYGTADPASYPLQKKGHSLEFLREVAHLRPRTNTFGAVFRIRHAMAYAVHTFFNNKGFFYIHTPIITASDAEGAGEMFRVTTFDLPQVPLTPEGTPDYSRDFFGKPANLTVSGQLEGELAAMALSEVYTFGPTFRAENSNTARHLAEFWMIEPEMAFCDIHDNMDLAEEFLKYLIGYALEHCEDDLEFLNNMYDKELLQKLRATYEAAFERITYTQAIDILADSKEKFEYPCSWGADLQSEHERFLTEKYFKKPVIITDYPKEIKAFYMKQNDDGKTVRGMDVLVPGIGEIIGGSQREDNHEKLVSRMQEVGIHPEDLWWYLDTRRFGSAPHSGFGLGFERLLLFVTGMSNIRDVIPFPRTPKSIEF